MDNLLIIGAGGHGKVVLEAAELQGKWNKITFLDDREDTKSVLEHPIIDRLSQYEKYRNEYKYAIIAIGNNEKRLEWIEKLLKVGYKIPTIIHPKASVSRYSSIEMGTVVLAGAVVNAGTSIGKGCIININASIDHETVVCDGVHVCSGAVVRSECWIGKGCFIEAGSCVRSGEKIGK